MSLFAHPDPLPTLSRLLLSPRWGVKCCIGGLPHPLVSGWIQTVGGSSWRLEGGGPFIPPGLFVPSGWWLSLSRSWKPQRLGAALSSSHTAFSGFPWLCPLAPLASGASQSLLVVPRPRPHLVNSSSLNTLCCLGWVFHLVPAGILAETPF